jgi:hypothetical protein
MGEKKRRGKQKADGEGRRVDKNVALRRKIGNM